MAAPEESIADIFGFLGVAGKVSVLELAFDRARTTAGPGDHKVIYTSSVEEGSVGRGKRVPVSMIPTQLLEAVNGKLEALGYAPLSPAWNAEPVGSGGENPTVWGERLDDLMRNVEPATRSRNGDQGGVLRGSFAVVAQDDDRLRWVVDPSTGNIRQGDGEVECVVTGTAEDLALMIGGEANLGMLLRSGRIRHLTGRDDVRAIEVARTMTAVLDVLSGGTERANGGRKTSS